MEHIVFLTGRLAQLSLQHVLESIAPVAKKTPFTWEVREIGLQVAGLMTADMIRRRVANPLSEGTSLPADATAISMRSRSTTA